MTHAERQARYRSAHPEYRERERKRLASRAQTVPGGRVVNPLWLTAKERASVRRQGADPTGMRADNGRPYVLWGPDGAEWYCTHGYLQGEPCPHACWFLENR